MDGMRNVGNARNISTYQMKGSVCRMADKMCRLWFKATVLLFNGF